MKKIEQGATHEINPNSNNVIPATRTGTVNENIQTGGTPVTEYTKCN